jgi:hypothetical protein
MDKLTDEEVQQILSFYPGNQLIMNLVYTLQLYQKDLQEAIVERNTFRVERDNALRHVDAAEAELVKLVKGALVWPEN